MREHLEFVVFNDGSYYYDDFGADITERDDHLSCTCLDYCELASARHDHDSTTNHNDHCYHDNNHHNDNVKEHDDLQQAIDHLDKANHHSFAQADGDHLMEAKDLVLLARVLPRERRRQTELVVGRRQRRRRRQGRACARVDGRRRERYG